MYSSCKRLSPFDWFCSLLVLFIPPPLSLPRTLLSTSIFSFVACYPLSLLHWNVCSSSLAPSNTILALFSQHPICLFLYPPFSSFASALFHLLPHPSLICTIYSSPLPTITLHNFVLLFNFGSSTSSSSAVVCPSNCPTIQNETSLSSF